jgi:cyclophilin family peptidyl-prolyl cis-trans isomerase
MWAGSFLSLLGAALTLDKVADMGATAESDASPYDVDVTVDLNGKEPGGEESFKVRVHPEWAPKGAARFQEIIKNNLLSDARFFRVVPGFVAQFGIPAQPQVAAQWREKTIQDDPVKVSNKRGTLVFATSGPNSRTTQMFINFNDNSNLDGMGFSPFGEVVGEGMSVVDKINPEYGERPNQGEIQMQGNAYLEKDFPDMAYIKKIGAEAAKGAAPANGTVPATSTAQTGSGAQEAEQ